MDRVRHPSASPTLPDISTAGNTAGYFTKGDPSLGIAPTIPTADWANGITEELCGAITESGQIPAQTNLTQLATAVANISKRKNAIINGRFGVWQRGTSGSLAAGGAAYSADRWRISCQNDVTCSWSQGTYAIGTGPNESKYYLNLSYGAGTAGSLVQQSIEGVETFNGKTVTVSFYASSTVDLSSTISLTTNETQYSATFNLASIAGKTKGANNNDSLQVYIIFSSTSAFVAKLNSVQLEVGSLRTQYEVLPFEMVLALCQRYFEKSFPYATAPAQNAGTTGAVYNPQTVAASATQPLTSVRYSVPKRTVPTITIYNPSAANAQVRNIGANLDCSSTTVSGLSSEYSLSLYTTTATGSASGNGLIFHWTADCEL